MVEKEEAKDHLLQVLRDLADRDTEACCRPRTPPWPSCWTAAWSSAGPPGPMPGQSGSWTGSCGPAPLPGVGRRSWQPPPAWSWQQRNRRYRPPNVKSMIRALVEYTEGSLLPDEIKDRTQMQ